MEDGTMWNRTLAVISSVIAAALLIGACADSLLTEPRTANLEAPVLDSGSGPKLADLTDVSLANQPMSDVCGAVIESYFAHPIRNRLEVVGTRVPIDLLFGSSFTMRNDYFPDHHRLDTEDAKVRSIFLATRGSSHFAGTFHEVLPSRATGTVDRREFWVSRSGVFFVRHVGGMWTLLQEVTCRRGPQNQLLVTGSDPDRDFWTFVMRPITLVQRFNTFADPASVDLAAPALSVSPEAEPAARWSASTALAAGRLSQVACGAAINGYLTEGVLWLGVMGTRISAHGPLGISSFTMQDGYSLRTHRIGTAGAAERSRFFLRMGSTRYDGYFHEVFPGRGTAAVDRWQFRVDRDGTFSLRSITRNPLIWIELQETTCYSGPGNQLVATGLVSNASEVTAWAFVIRPEPPIH
jgi:hypothetical protein